VAAAKLHLIKQMRLTQPASPPLARRLLPPRKARVLCAAVLLGPCLPASGTSAELPDAPAPQWTKQSHEPRTGPGPDNQFLGGHVGPSYPLVAQRFDTIIHPGEQALRLSATDKLLYAAHEQGRWFILFPALITTGYGHAVDTDPHVGSDGAGFGERLALTMVRQGTDRFMGNGLYTALFRQDPRFYREGNGPVVHRGLRAVRQTYMRRNDEGAGRVNASGILGHLTASLLAMTYYPHESATIGVAMRGFGTAVAGDMGSKLVLEFGPDTLRLIFFRNKK
jgi:hypothetical protein